MRIKVAQYKELMQYINDLADMFVSTVKLINQYELKKNEIEVLSEDISYS